MAFKGWSCKSLQLHLREEAHDKLSSNSYEPDTAKERGAPRTPLWKARFWARFTNGLPHGSFSEGGNNGLMRSICKVGTAGSPCPPARRATRSCALQSLCLHPHCSFILEGHCPRLKELAQCYCSHKASPGEVSRTSPIMMMVIITIIFHNTHYSSHLLRTY